MSDSDSIGISGSNDQNDSGTFSSGMGAWGLRMRPGLDEDGDDRWDPNVLRTSGSRSEGYRRKDLVIFVHGTFRGSEDQLEKYDRLYRG